MFRNDEDALPELIPTESEDVRARALFVIAVERARLAGGYWDRIFAFREIRTRMGETTKVSRR